MGCWVHGEKWACECNPQIYIRCHYIHRISWICEWCLDATGCEVLKFITLVLPRFMAVRSCSSQNTCCASRCLWNPSAESEMGTMSLAYKRIGLKCVPVESLHLPIFQPSRRSHLCKAQIVSGRGGNLVQSQSCATSPLTCLLELLTRPVINYIILWYPVSPQMVFPIPVSAWVIMPMAPYQRPWENPQSSSKPGLLNDGSQCKDVKTFVTRNVSFLINYCK